MRLHLNKTLRAALIAAITAVGFTLTQAQAATISATETWGIPHDVKIGSSVTVDGTELDLTSMSCNADPNTNAGVAGVFAPNKNIGNGDTWTLTFTIDNTSEHDITLNSLLLDVSMYQAGGGAQTRGTVRTVDFKLMTGTDTLSELDIIMQGVGDVSKPGVIYNSGDTKPSLTFGSGVQITAGSSQTFTLTAAKGSSTDPEYIKGCCYGLIDLVASYTYEGVIPTWKGGEHTTWSDAEAWSGGVPTASLPAIFDNTGTTSTVVINSAAQAASVSVSGKEYTFDLSEGGSLTTGTLSIADGAKLTVNGEGRTMNIGALSTEGELAIGTGATVSMGADVTLDASHTLNVTGDGTFAIQKLTVSGGDHTLGVGLNMTEIGLNGGTVTFASGTSTVSGKVYSNSDTTKLVIGAETGETAVLKANRIEMGDVYNNSKHHDLTINAGGTLKVTGNDDGTSYKDASLVLGEWGVATPIVTVKGKLIAEKTHILAGDKGYTMDINGGTVLAKGLKTNGSDRTQTINISNSGKLILGDAGIINDNTHNGVTLTVDGGTIGVYADSVTIDKAITVSGAATFDTQKHTVDDITITRGDAGCTLTVSGNITGTGSITKTGAGTLVLSGTGNALSHTMNVQGGTLKLSGTIAIDNITDGEQVVKTVDYEGRDSVNGFHMATGTVKVYATSGDGQISLAEGGKFTYQNVDVTDQVVGGVYTLAGTPDKSVVYVTDGSLAIANYVTDALTSVVLSNNTTVNMDAATTVGLTLADGATATVNADEATTISSISGAAAKLVVTGDSVVTLASANAALTAAVEIGGTATVKLGNVNALGNTSGVTVLTGATLDVNGTKDQNTCIAVTLAGGTLTNTGNEASFGSKQLIKDLVVTQDSTVNTAAHDFGIVNGSYAATKLALNATLEKVGSHDFHLANTTVTGAGAIKVTEGAVWFGRATNAGIGSYASNFIMNGGKVKGRLSLNSNITVTTAAEGSTFEATVANGGHTITYVGDYDLTVSGAISGDGGIVKDGTGTLTLSGNNTYTGTTEVKDGKLVVNGTVGTGEIILAENASIENNGTGAITLSDVNVQLTQVENYGEGVLKLQNASGTLSVVELNIAPGSTISFYDKGETPAEGTITVTEHMMAGGGTLLANLTMANGSTLDVNGGDAMALTLGSRFTIAEGALVTLDDATLAAIADLANINDKVILINQLDGSTLTTNLEDGDWARTHFDLSSITGADFTMYVQEGQIGIMKSSNVPEPTTGTLSLLALMALAARRRRK